MTAERKEYVLGTGRDELERLALQHRIWADATTAVWKRAGIGPGTRVLDLGAGPGFASMDLAQLVTHAGRVVAFDESEEFAGYVRAQAETLQLPQIEVKLGDAQAIDLPAGSFDAVYCRWVLCWLADPLAALRGVRKALKPGGRFVIHDYFNWRAMGVAPRSKAVEKMVLAAVASFEERKGDIDIAGRLPALLEEAGFKLTHFDVHQRAARGGGVDSTVAWPLTWWRTYGPKLVASGKLAADTYAQAARDLDTLERDPNRFFACPTLYEFIATPA